MLTLRDHTELESLSGELDRVQGFSDALRAQAHESANRLHTVISLIELGETDHALTFAVAELQTAQSLADRVLEGVGNPAVAALLLAKSAQAAERGIELTVRQGSYLPPDAAPDHELVTIVGNLVDNAFDVLSGMRRTTARGGCRSPDETVDHTVRLITVTDSGPGLTPEQATSVFARGWSTKTARGPAGDRGLGLALVAQAVARCGGTVVVQPGKGAKFIVSLPYRGAVEDDAVGLGGRSVDGAVAGEPQICGHAGGSKPAMIHVLVVEDEPIAARAHRAYVERVAGFSVAAVAHSRVEAERALGRGGVDLVLLDLHLPDGSGLDLFRRIRAAGSTVDVMVVSSARDADIVRSAVAQGAVQYVIKPFAFGTLRDRLLAYQEFRNQVAGDSDVDQAAVDKALGMLRSPAGETLPKGMTKETLAIVIGALREFGEASATQIADFLGVSRITARRYLEHLADTNAAERSLRYGQVGRPETRYGLRKPSN